MSVRACPSARGSWLRAVPPLLGVALSAAVVLWLARAVDLDALAGVLRQARPGLVLLLVLLAVLSNLVRALRLHVVLQSRTSLLRTIHAYNIGVMVNCLLPLRSGDMCMALLLGPHLPGGRSEALSRLFVDRVFDLLAVLTIFAATLPLLSQAQAQPLAAGGGLWVAGAGLLGIIGAAWSLCAFEPLAQRCVRSLAQVLRRNPALWESRASAVLVGVRSLFHGRVLFLGGGLSLLTWALVVLSFQVGMAALFAPPALACAMLAMCLTVLGLIVAPMPAGIGTTHGAIVLGLGIFGIGTEQALAFAILYHALTTIVSLLLGTASLWICGFSLGALLRGARAAPQEQFPPVEPR